MALTPVNDYLGEPFIELQSVGSTNNYALDQIHSNLAHPGTCYFAHDQTAGKGQRGKSWITEKGANITMSLITRPSFLQPFEQFYLSACIAGATHQFLNHHTGRELKIKWPNDLYWRNQKLGGILIENIIQADKKESKTGIKQKDEISSNSNWQWAVIGIGININQTHFQDLLSNPVSLRQITGKSFDTIQLAKDLCKTIDVWYRQLTEEGRDPILKSYNDALYKVNEPVKFRKDNRNFIAVVKSVDRNGQLIIQHSLEEKISFGEVEWLVEKSPDTLP
ncbi:MAG TPA: biotin--[acetyl-CoA-carboxylase] ligase [Chitinophagaceae bacterium]